MNDGCTHTPPPPPETFLYPIKPDWFRVLLCFKTSLSAKMSSACSFIFIRMVFTLRLALKQRHKETRKWPIARYMPKVSSVMPANSQVV